MSSPNPTPKQVFQSSESRVKKHANLIARPEFRDAVDTAMLELCRQETMDPDVDTGQRLRGAHAFMSVFLGLAEIRTAPVRNDPDNLLKT